MLPASSGVGMSHITTALSNRAVRAGIKTRFINAANLILQLATLTARVDYREYFAGDPDVSNGAESGLDRNVLVRTDGTNRLVFQRRSFA